MSLVTLVIFFKDSLIEWWEAAMLLAIYFAYVGFMKINPQAERFVKKLLYKNKVTRVRSTDHLVPTVSENSMKIMQSISFSLKKNAIPLVLHTHFPNRESPKFSRKIESQNLVDKVF